MWEGVAQVRFSLLTVHVLGKQHNSSSIQTSPLSEKRAGKGGCHCGGAKRPEPSGTQGRKEKQPSPDSRDEKAGRGSYTHVSVTSNRPASATGSGAKSMATAQAQLLEGKTGGNFTLFCLVTHRADASTDSPCCRSVQTALHLGFPVP